jgi:hypothetical protein
MTAALRYRDDLGLAEVFRLWVRVRLVCALEADEPDDVCVVPDLSVTVDHRNELRPDVVVMREPLDDVLLAVTILSPGSVGDNCALQGIPRRWVIDPLGERMTFTEHVLGSDGECRSGPPRAGGIYLDRPWPVSLDLSSFERRRDRHR